MSKHKDASTLAYGCDIISQQLRYFLCPMGWMFRSDPPPNRPRPLTLFVVLMNCATPFVVIIIDYVLISVIISIDHNTEEYQAIASSVFILRLSKFMGLCRICYFSMILLILTQHGSISNVIASSNNFVSEKEQKHFARRSFTIFFFKSVATFLSYVAILLLYYFKPETPSRWMEFVALLSLKFAFLVNLTQSSPMIYTCYFGASLGKHVENFSRIYVDTMFDQFMKAIEADGAPSTSSASPLAQSEHLAIKNHSSQEAKRSCLKGCGWCVYLRTLCRYIVKGFSLVLDFFKEVGARLNSNKYPELPEMKMTKLSSTQNIQISETMRMANNHLIRIRLRRTQIMLSELRDLVSDINRTSSPIVLLYLVHETVSIILITTASIQTKVYRSIDFLIVPTVSTTIGLVIGVIYICTCLDETSKQLKLMINKLFDFIIMNHRVQSTGKRTLDPLAGEQQVDSSKVCIMLGNESGAINETWSQFQYTRKLARTIQFTMGGIVPITRRMVLSILGHILSAVFISIEIMSIVDTSSPAHAGHAPPSSGPRQAQPANVSAAGTH